MYLRLYVLLEGRKYHGAIRIAFGGIAVVQDSTVDVELGSFYIDMPTTIPTGPVTLNVTAVGEMPHTITIEGNGVSMTMPETLSGSSTT